MCSSQINSDHSHQLIDQNVVEMLQSVSSSQSELRATHAVLPNGSVSLGAFYFVPNICFNADVSFLQWFCSSFSLVDRLCFSVL